MIKNPTIELEIEKHKSEELIGNQQLNEHQSHTFVSFGFGQCEYDTKEPNARVIEFMRRYKDFDGFDENMFLKENIGFFIVLEIDHNNQSVFFYSGTETFKTTSRELDGEIKVIFLKDFIEEIKIPFIGIFI